MNRRRPLGEKYKVVPAESSDMSEDIKYTRLRDSQIQIDEDGAMVGVSRQALDEFVDSWHEAQDNAAEWELDCIQAEADSKKLSEKIAVLESAYGKYAGHFVICKIFDDMTDGGDTTQGCDCGFEQALTPKEEKVK